MGTIEDEFDELEADITLEQFRDRVADKIEETAGLMDEESAAMLVAHELDEHRPVPIAEIDPDLERVTILGEVRHISERRTFERDDGEQGAVINVTVADETGQIRAAFWDEKAAAAEEELDRGDTLRLRARPREGFDGIEVSVTDVRRENDLEVEVATPEATAIADCTPGMEGVSLAGEVLRIDEPRTFERDDGTEGRVGTVVIGDESGAIDVTLWGDATEAVDAVAVGDTAVIEGAGVRERDGRIEVHVGGRAVLEPAEEPIRYEPAGDPIEALDEGDTATITGIVRSTDPVRTFDRDDGTEGQVRNIQVQDTTDSIRVALWGEKADVDLAPGDEVTCIDVLVKEGFRDDLEASANWRSTVVERAGEVREPEAATAPDDDSPEQPTVADTGDDQPTLAGVADGADEDAGPVEFTGTVVQPNAGATPLVLDDGEETMHVEYDGDVTLGERVTVVGPIDEDTGRLVADRLERTDGPR